jgi:protein-disulfide isomerase
MRRVLALIPVIFLACATQRSATQPAVGPLDLQAEGVSGLNPDAEATVRSVAIRSQCPCGGAHSLDECLRTHRTCRSAPRRLQLAAKLVKMGATAAEADHELTAYRISFFNARRTFEVSPALCKGPADAKVTAVEFSDFECPACANARLLMESLPEAIPGLRLCFRHFPLKRHAHAFDAAQAAEFAGEKGRFWEFHDLLFDGQNALELDDLKRYARILELDDAAMEAALKMGTYVARVHDSREEGVLAGVDSTPSLFINGRRLTLPMDADLIVHSVQDELVFQSDGR